jgi:GNAT superfamily N-acetyltransferase
MAGQRLPGTQVRVRRCRRHDLSPVRALLGVEADGRFERLFARLVRDLGGDLYVAEDVAGEIVGLVSLRYTRSLAQRGMAAILDQARAQGGADAPLLDGLVAFAEARARRRGCHHLTAWVDERDGALRAALVARGYRSGIRLTLDLGGAA